MTGLGALLALAHGIGFLRLGADDRPQGRFGLVVIARRHLVKPPHGLRRRAPEPSKALIPTPLQLGIDAKVHLCIRHSNPFQNC